MRCLLRTLTMKWWCRVLSKWMYSPGNAEDFLFCMCKEIILWFYIYNNCHPLLKTLFDPFAILGSALAMSFANGCNPPPPPLRGWLNCCVPEKKAFFLLKLHSSRSLDNRWLLESVEHPRYFCNTWSANNRNSQKMFNKCNYI